MNPLPVYSKSACSAVPDRTQTEYLDFIVVRPADHKEDLPEILWIEIVPGFSKKKNRRLRKSESLIGTVLTWPPGRERSVAVSPSLLACDGSDVEQPHLRDRLHAEKAFGRAQVALDWAQRESSESVSPPHLDELDDVVVEARGLIRTRFVDAPAPALACCISTLIFSPDGPIEFTLSSCSNVEIGEFLLPHLPLGLGAVRAPVRRPDIEIFSLPARAKLVSSPADDLLDAFRQGNR